MISDIEVTVSSSVVRNMDRVVQVLGGVAPKPGFSNDDLQVIADAQNTLELLFCQDDENLQFGDLGYMVCRDLPWYKGVMLTLEAVGYDPNCFLEVLDTLGELLALRMVEEDEYDFAEDFCLRVSEEIWNYFTGRHGKETVCMKEAEPTGNLQVNSKEEAGIDSRANVSLIAQEQTLGILVELAAILDVEIDAEILVGIALEELRPTLKLIELFSGESALTEMRTRDEAENFILLYRLDELVTEGRLQEVAIAIMASRIMNMHHAVGVYLADTEISIEGEEDAETA